jgi:hypothetical protein
VPNSPNNHTIQKGDNITYVGVGTVQKPTTKSRFKMFLPIIPLIVIVLILVYLFPSQSSNSTTFNIHGAVLGTQMSQKPGLTVNGTFCGPGIRQVDWSNYAPYCEPKFSGNNGGSTSFGVTRTTITVTSRVPSSSLNSLAAAFFPASMVGTAAQATQTFNTYVKLFNNSFELYGRHVVIVPFNGKGNELSELQGQGLEQAQQDALTAKSLHAFADISLLSSTQIYDQYLADEKIIAIGGLLQPQYWFQQYAPYEFSPAPTCNSDAEVTATVLGRSMAGLPAIFSGDPKMQHTIRKFGIIYPQNPNYASCALELVSILKNKYHTNVVRQIAYSINIAEGESQAKNAVAQFQTRGVTSIICACDPLFPIFLVQNATAQKYYPEWLALDFGDIFGQKIAPTSQWENNIAGGITSPPKIEQEAYRAYKLEDPTGTPSPEFAAIYEPLLQLFTGLQAAGPDLTPETFAEGLFSMPTSKPGGEFGKWKYGQDVFSPVDSFQVLRWSPTTVSQQDGLKGSFIACNNGKLYTFSTSGATSLPNHVQLSCPEP